MLIHTDDAAVTLTKAEYDRMIDRFPIWMSTVWVKFPKLYNITTVHVTGCAGSGLAERLNYVRGLTNSVS